MGLLSSPYTPSLCLYDNLSFFRRATITTGLGIGGACGWVMYNLLGTKYMFKTHFSGRRWWLWYNGNFTNLSTLEAAFESAGDSIKEEMYYHLDLLTTVRTSF